MVKKLAFRIGLSLIALLICASVSMADPVDWSAFKDATFSDIYCTFNHNQGGSYDYTLTLGDSPTITCSDLGLRDSAVSNVFGFYLISNTLVDREHGSGQVPQLFYATGASAGNWTWDTDPSNAQPNSDRIPNVDVAGWFLTGNGNDEELLEPKEGKNSRTFHFTDLKLGATDVFFGLHVTYAIPNGNGATDTSWFKGEIAPVPEPGTILAALSVLAPAGFVFRRKRA